MREREPVSRVVLWIVGCLLVAAFFWIFLQPLSALVGWPFTALAKSQIRLDLALARARWEAHDMPNYDMQVQGGNVLGCFVWEGTVVVRGGEFVALLDEKRNPIRGDELCPSEQFTVEGMFDKLESDLETLDDFGYYTMVSFDPIFGFVRRYHTGCVNPYMADCGLTFTFGDLRPRGGD